MEFIVLSQLIFSPFIRTRKKCFSLLQSTRIQLFHLKISKIYFRGGIWLIFMYINQD